MRHSSAVLAATLALFQSLALANPLPQYSFAQGNDDGGGACAANANPVPEYEVTSQEPKDGAPVQISQSCKPHKGDTCLLGKENSYEVSVTVSVGANLDFGAIVAAGVSAEVSTSTAKGTTDSNQQECTGPWSCSIILTPEVQEVAGKQFVWVGCPSEKKEFAYTAQFPIKSGDNLPIQHGELCQCRNYDGFDDGAEDAPVPCPNDC